MDDEAKKLLKRIAFAVERAIHMQDSRFDECGSCGSRLVPHGAASCPACGASADCDGCENKHAPGKTLAGDDRAKCHECRAEEAAAVSADIAARDHAAAIEAAARTREGAPALTSSRSKKRR